jgi:O-antigen/teichoic acid export membrane protein
LTGNKTGSISPDGATGRRSYLPHVAKGATINFSGAIVRMVLLYGYTLLLAWLLPASELGQYFLMFTIINILGLVSVAGLDLGVVHYVSIFTGRGDFRKTRHVVNAALMVGVSLGAAIAVALFFIAPVLADPLFDGSENAVRAMRIFAIAVPFWAIAKLSNSVTQAMHRMRYQVYSRDFGEQSSKVILSLIVLAFGAGLVGVVWANVAALMSAAALSMLFAAMIMPRVAGGDDEGLAKVRSGLFRYSLPLAFSNVFGIILLYSDMLLVGYLGTSTDAGYYGAALRVGVTGSVAILTAFRTVFAPVISDLYDKRKIGELRVLFKTVTRWIFICSYPLLLLLIIFSGTIMGIFGSGFSEGRNALLLLALGQMMNAGTGLVGMMVIMSGRSHMELYNVLTSLVVNVSLCFLLIPDYGITGAAIANMSAVAVINLMRAIEVWVIMHMNAYDRNYLVPLFAGATGAAAAVMVIWIFGGDSWAMVVLSALLFVTVYTPAVFLLGMNEEDRAVIRMFKSRLLPGRA